MIVRCPSCDARFRLNREKLAGKRVTMRCARCSTPFKVELPHISRSDNVQQVRVMIAHSDPELCGTIKKIVEAAGFEGILSHTGEEALCNMEAAPPSVAVVDVALEGLYAFEVVDKIRHRPGLANVKIILLSSVYNRAAYKRLPLSLYGADDYIEKHHIPDDLVLKINRLLVGAVPAAGPTRADEVEKPGKKLTTAEKSSQTTEFIMSVNQQIQTAEDHQVTAEGSSLQARAERFARILVSDISLYYQDRIDEGILEGNWSELLAKEIKEARRLFSDRFPDPAIRKSKILEAAFLDLLHRRSQELGA